jgi:peptide/nickel transport system substrate-binding protein
MSKLFVFATLLLPIAISTGCEALPFGGRQALPVLATTLPEPTVEPTATRMLPQPTQGHLVVAIPHDPAGFDPHLTVSPSSFETIRYIYDTLVRTDAQGMPQAGLAERWEVSEDGRVWSFYLKDGILFHSGKNLTGQDVAYSIERLIDPATANLRAKDYSFIDSLTISDTLTVNIRLNEPRATLPLDLANEWAAIVPEEAGNQLYYRPIGTGPFQLKEWEKGNYVTLQRSLHITESVEPSIDEISFRIIPTETARLDALKAGEVDIVSGLSVAAMRQLHGDPDIVLAPVPARQVKVLAFNHEKAPFADALVRQGIQYGINRQALIDTVWPEAAVSSGGELSPSDPYYVDLTSLYPRDVERAKALLGDAGYVQGLDTTLTVPLDDEYLRIADELVRQLAEFGVRAEIVAVDWTVFMNQVYFGRDFELTTMTHRGKLDPIAAFSRYTSDSPWNYLNYRNRAYDELVSEAAEADAEDLSTVFAELQRTLTEDAAAVYLSAPLTTTAMRSRVKNCQLLPDGSCDLRLIRKEP